MEPLRIINEQQQQQQQQQQQKDVEDEFARYQSQQADIIRPTSPSPRGRLDTAETPTMMNYIPPMLSRHTSAPQQVSSPIPSNDFRRTNAASPTPGDTCHPSLVSRQVSAPSTHTFIQQLQQKHQYTDDEDDCIDCVSVVSSLSMDDSQYVPSQQQQQQQHAQQHRRRSFVPLRPAQQQNQQPAANADNYNVPPPMEVIVSTNEHVSLRVSGKNRFRGFGPAIPTTICENSKENIFDTVAPLWLNQNKDDNGGHYGEDDRNNDENDNYNENCVSTRRKSLIPPSMPQRINPFGDREDNGMLPPPPPHLRTTSPSPQIPRPTLGSQARSWTFSSSHLNSSFDGSGEGRLQGETPRQGNLNNSDVTVCSSYFDNETSCGDDDNANLVHVKGQLSDDPTELMKDARLSSATNIAKPSILNRHRRCKSGTSLGSLPSQGYSTLITVPTATSSIESVSTVGDSFKQAQKAQHKLLSLSGEEDGSACCRVHHEKSFNARRRGNFMKRFIVNATTTVTSPKVPSMLKKNPLTKSNVNTTRKSAGCLT